MLRGGYFSSWHSMTKKKMSQVKYICFSSKKNQEILPFCSFALWSIKKRILSQTRLALPHVKRIERRVRRNNCLICPFACRCPNHSRLIHKMQAWMSEGLLRWGGAFQRLWTAVPPVITTLNLAGHSSAPLIEHLNLTRCYCHVLTNRQMPCYPRHHHPHTPSSPPAYYGIFLFHRSVMHGRLRLWKWGGVGGRERGEAWRLLSLK